MVDHALTKVAVDTVTSATKEALSSPRLSPRNDQPVDDDFIEGDDLSVMSQSTAGPLSGPDVEDLNEIDSALVTPAEIKSEFSDEVSEVVVSEEKKEEVAPRAAEPQGPTAEDVLQEKKGEEFAPRAVEPQGSTAEKVLQEKLDAALKRASAAEAEVTRRSEEMAALRSDYEKLKVLEENEHISLERAEVSNEILAQDLQEQKVHEKELLNIDKFLAEIAMDMTDERLSSTITELVEEYLVFCDYRNTADCFTAEARCNRFKPTFGYNSERTAIERAGAAKNSLLGSFDGGDETAFFSTWASSVPPHLVNTSKANKTLKFKLHVHFATFALKKRIVYDPDSPFPCSPVESEALDSLKKFLHDASDDSEIMEEPSLFPFFTLSSITHPQKHNSFVSPGSTTAIFADDTLSGDDTLSNIWTMKLREELLLFCDNRLPLVSPPKLVTLFQAFHKWESSLQSHVVEGVKVCKEFRDLAVELMGQNVKLIAALGGKDPVTSTYIQNMRRFIIHKKHQMDKMVARIEPSKDLVNQPPPISFKSLKKFMIAHKGESKLLGHVLHALMKRMDGAEDKEVRRHAAHDAATGDVLGTYNLDGGGVVLDLLSLRAGASAIKKEHDGRATYYAALMIANMAKYKAGRVYLVGEGGGQGIIERLITCVKNSLDGQTCLEAGMIALVGLERMSLEMRAQLDDSVVLKYVAKLMSTVGVSKNVPSNCFFLHKLMADADHVEAEKNLMDDPTYVSPIKRHDTWKESEAWKHLRSVLVGYGSALLCNICGRSGSAGEGAGLALVEMVRSCNELEETQYAKILLKACYRLSSKPDARLEANEAGAVAAVEKLAGKMKGKEKHMANWLLKRLRGEEGGGGGGGGEGEGEEVKAIDSVEEDVFFGFQRAIEGEEKIHAAIDNVEEGELPPGWETAEDPATGSRYFYKSDGTDSLWTLPSASDRILEAFYLGRER